MNNTKYYKVVYDTCFNTYESCVIQGVSSVVYKPDEWTVSTIPYSKLFVFDNLEDAKAFWDLWSFSFNHIWECEVENPSFVDNIIMLTCGKQVDVQDVISFWKNGCRLLDCKNVEIKTPVKGTVCVDRVKLVKRIY